MDPQMHAPGYHSSHCLPVAGLKPPVENDVYRFNRVVPLYTPDPCIPPNAGHLICPPDCGQVKRNDLMEAAGMKTPIETQFQFYEPRPSNPQAKPVCGCPSFANQAPCTSLGPVTDRLNCPCVNSQNSCGIKGHGGSIPPPPTPVGGLHPMAGGNQHPTISRHNPMADECHAMPGGHLLMSNGRNPLTGGHQITGGGHIHPMAQYSVAAPPHTPHPLHQPHRMQQLLQNHQQQHLRRQAERQIPQHQLPNVSCRSNPVQPGQEWRPTVANINPIDNNPYMPGSSGFSNYPHMPRTDRFGHNPYMAARQPGNNNPHMMPRPGAIAPTPNAMSMGMAEGNGGVGEGRGGGGDRKKTITLGQDGLNVDYCCQNPYYPSDYVCRPVYDRKYLDDCPEQDGPPADTYTFL